MKRKRKLLSARAIVAFVAFLTISGSALAATGHIDNPVIALKDTVAMDALIGGPGSIALPAVGSGSSQTLVLTSLDTTTAGSSVAALPPLSSLPSDSTSADASMSLPPLSSLPSDSTSADASMSLPPLQDATAANVTAPDEGIRWSEIGDVLFDLWFIAAVTAFVIVFQHASGFARSRLSRTA